MREIWEDKLLLLMLVTIVLAMLSLPVIIYWNITKSTEFAAECAKKGGVVLRTHESECICIDPKVIL